MTRIRTQLGALAAAVADTTARVDRERRVLRVDPTEVPGDIARLASLVP